MNNTDNADELGTKCAELKTPRTKRNWKMALGTVNESGKMDATSRFSYESQNR